MTREEARKNEKITDTYVEGKKVKVFYDDRKCCEEDDRDPNFLPEQYHVKKEPSRPFHNAEECLNEMMKHQPFGWVYDKNNNQFLNTNRVGNDGVDFYGRQRNTFAKANSYITFADKEPFGIKDVQTYYAYKNETKIEKACDGLGTADAEPNLASLWHDASEEPRCDELLLGEDTDGFSIYRWCGQEDYWETFVNETGLSRWAYIEDLLPKGGEE